MKDHDTQVGLQKSTNTAILISDVKVAGLDCNCVCLDCGRSLIAVINFKNSNATKYFQHHNPSDEIRCIPSSGSRETALHLALKKQILKEKRIAAPRVLISKECPYEHYKYQDFSVYSGVPLNFDNVLLEKKAGSIIPDCIGIIGNYRIGIEVKVTHGVDDEKIEKYKSLGMDCLEVYAPKKMDDLRPSFVINDNSYMKWQHFGRKENQETIQACEAWFENEKGRIEEIIETKKKKLIESDILLRPKRIEKLMRKAMVRWDDTYLRFSSFDHSLYYEFDHNLDDLCSRVPGLVYLSFPYAMKYELKKIGKELDGLRQQEANHIREYSSARKRLVAAFEYQYGLCNFNSFERIGSVLERIDDNSEYEIRTALRQYFDDMRNTSLDVEIEKLQLRWIKKQKSSGRVFENPSYDYISSLQFEKDKKNYLESKGFEGGIKFSFYEFIDSYLLKKRLVDNKSEVIDPKQTLLKRQYFKLQKELNNKVILYIQTIIGSHKLERGELSDCAERLLSSSKIAIECAKELIFIKMAADFNRQVFPYNRSIRESIEKQISEKLNAMSDKHIKLEIGYFKAMGDLSCSSQLSVYFNKNS
jgi:hypothetical protein